MTDAADDPVGPADDEYPRRALSRLGLSAAARTAADRASSLVPTTADDPSEMVELAHHLVEEARGVLTRAVVHARENGVSWTEIGDRHGEISKQSAQERYKDVLAEWEDALDRPWTHSGRFLNCRLPEGLSDPSFTANTLDQWCTRHAPDSTQRLAERDGVADRMVAANLPAHTGTTRINLVLRRNKHLYAREAAGDDVAAEWADHRQRRQELYEALDDRDRRGLATWNTKEEGR
ncbi:hypothetical protein [Actinopolyspora halophila]|uniref:hypothetical protein n=1 Tax=Actinopolyspora halophila TaxID=1850 RepID=UPI00037F8A24|nr:hypothetical protein [Actinopolyspora halophila]